MKGYKAFSKGLICRGKQYKVGETYTEDKAVPCERGMHFCEGPFDVWNYYDIFDADMQETEYAEVEAVDEPVTDDNQKYCTTKLRIVAKLSFAEFIKAGIDFLLEKTKPRDDRSLNDNGTKAARIGSSGYSAQIGSSGDYAQIGSSGDSARIGSSGGSARIGSSGDSAQIGSSGYSAQIGSSGYSARIGSSGNYAQIGSSGYSARIGSSGYSARIGSSGDSAQIGSSGDSAQIGSSGDSAQIGSSGDSAQIGSSGEDAVICCAGKHSRAKAKKGSWITLSEWVYHDTKERWVPACVKTEQVDGERIKEDTWYKLENGEFVEVEE